MTERPKPTEVAAVKCEVCLIEIPRSEAHCAEAEDYVLYFCGLDCYREWAASGGKATAPSDASRRG